MQIYDLATFLEGRELTVDEQKLVEAAVASAKDHLDVAFDQYVSFPGLGSNYFFLDFVVFYCALFFSD